MKKTLSVILALAIFFSLAIPCSATTISDDDLSGSNVSTSNPLEIMNAEYNEYISYVEQGILSDEVTFEAWKYYKEKALDLEAALEASSEFDLVYDSNGTNLTNASYSMKAGDIFITNGTSLGGLTGHAGIALSAGGILHIAGPGTHPSTVSLSYWNSNYTNATSSSWTKVYRNSSSTKANDAANWARNTYVGSSAVYMINYNVESTYETYCSKIVWQAYYYGANSATYLPSGLILPYDLPGLISNVSLVQTL